VGTRQHEILMKVFYSWQSDTPRDVGKDFIRGALDRAIAGLEIEEAERPVVDQDTEGVRGSPVIADTIFQKISAADIVVVDVTLVGKTEREKRLINSNAAIEMGYALGVHGDEVLLKVMNTYYGPPDDLPFDLRHRRWPVKFALPPNATRSERDRVLAQLSETLKGIIAQYLEASRPPPEEFSPTESTYNRAAYWRPSEALVELNAASPKSAQHYRYDAAKPLIYLHIWPNDKIEPLSAKILTEYDKVSIEPLCGTPSGWSNHRNRFGHIAYAWDAETDTLLSTTQVFKTGEIWGVNQYMLRARPPHRDFIPIPAFETKLRKSLMQYLTNARSYFGYGREIQVACGMVNVNGFVLALSNDAGSDRIFEDIVAFTTLDADDADSVEASLVKIFAAVYEAAGEVRR
jgi:hypothetical protein